MEKGLILIESPGKQRTIEKIMGKSYTVKASYGHIMNLNTSKLSINIDNGFEPEYEILKDKKKVVKDILSCSDKNTVVWVCSDNDAQGQLIALHLKMLFEKRGKYKDIRRAVYSEITKEAIIKAFANPVPFDIAGANRAIGQRVLDRLVGYNLSPILWRKIKFGLSAGRVVSPTLRLTVDREKEILAFNPEEYWKLRLNISDFTPFKAELHKADNKIIKVTNGNDANMIKLDCESNSYTLEDITEKDSTRNPAPPFTTSTLQQEAGRKLGMSIKNTMSTAQKLYEGNDINVPGHTGGFITYMRTDSMNLSKLAIDMAKDLIVSEYGKNYLNPYVRTYGKKKGAQEAHEAIRPANLKLKPSDVKRYMNDYEFKLYSLIWKRTVATQMSSAKVSNTTYKISGGANKKYEFISKGTKILFPGFMKAYTEGSDDPSQAISDKDVILPTIAKGTTFNKVKIVTEQLFTKPPARYTEAALVKKLESLGIGRPSTYASTIGSIISRQYVEVTDDKRLKPTTIGIAVSDYLVDKFPKIMDYKFTANIETQFDNITSDPESWKKVIRDFYKDFEPVVKKELADKERVSYSKPTLLGTKDGLNVYARLGAYGEYVQLGEPYDKEDPKSVKPRVASLPKGKTIDNVTLEEALHYLTLPRELGYIDEKVIKSTISRFGPVLTYNNSFYGLKEDDPYTITLDRAKEIIKQVDEERSKAIWLTFPEEQIKVIDGRYGPYIELYNSKAKGKKKKTFFKIPRDKQDENIIKKMTLEEVKDIMKNQPKSSGRKFKKKKIVH